MDVASRYRPDPIHHASRIATDHNLGQGKSLSPPLCDIHSPLFFSVFGGLVWLSRLRKLLRLRYLLYWFDPWNLRIFQESWESWTWYRKSSIKKQKCRGHSGLVFFAQAQMAFNRQGINGPYLCRSQVDPHLLVGSPSQSGGQKRWAALMTTPSANFALSVTLGNSFQINDTAASFPIIILTGL